MWQEIINKAKDNLTGEIRNKAGLNQEQADKSVEMAGDSTKEVLKEEAQQGNLQQIAGLFRGSNPASSGNPLVQKISNNLLGKLTSQLGLSQGAAQKVESVALPYLLNLINQKTGGSDSAPSPQSLMALLGGKDAIGGGVADKIKKGLGGMF